MFSFQVLDMLPLCEPFWFNLAFLILPVVALPVAQCLAFNHRFMSTRELESEVPVLPCFKLGVWLFGSFRVEFLVTGFPASGPWMAFHAHSQWDVVHWFLGTFMAHGRKAALPFKVISNSACQFACEVVFFPGEWRWFKAACRGLRAKPLWSRIRQAFLNSPVRLRLFLLEARCEECLVTA